MEYNIRKADEYRYNDSKVQSSRWSSTLREKPEFVNVPSKPRKDVSAYIL